MYKKSEFVKNSYKTGEVAKLLNVSNRTIQNYDRDGKLKVHRTENNRRCIMRDDLLTFLDSHGLLLDDESHSRRDVIYARVSSHDQAKNGDLDRQALFLVESVGNLHNPLILKEVGSGLNDKRKCLHTLISMVCNNEVSKVYITYKDRLTRFGYSYLETMFKAHDTDIVVVQNSEESKSVQEELVEDMMSLIASFSGKLYGMRSRKNKVRNTGGKYED